MKLLTLVLFAASFAAPTFATLSEGVAITPDYPGFGANLYADPGTIWLLYANDNPWFQGPNPINPRATGDDDFQDAKGRVHFSPLDTSNNTVAAQFEYLGGVSAWNNSIRINGVDVNSSSVGPFTVSGFPPDQLVIAELITPYPALTGHLYSGDGLLNPGGFVHFVIQQESCDAVPEPTTWMMLLIGSGLVLLGRKWSITWGK